MDLVDKPEDPAPAGPVPDRVPILISVVGMAAIGAGIALAVASHHPHSHALAPASVRPVAATAVPATLPPAVSAPAPVVVAPTPAGVPGCVMFCHEPAPVADANGCTLFCDLSRPSGVGR